MAAIGKGGKIIAVSKFKAEVSGFSDGVGKLHQVPIVDAVLRMCPTRYCVLASM